MRIEDPNNVLVGFFFIMILPYFLLGSMILIYWKYKKIYNKYKFIYYLLLFLLLIYVILSIGFNYVMGVLSGYKTGLDTVKITF